MRSILLVSLLAAFGSTPALAGNPLTTITVVDGATTWTEMLGTSTVFGGTAGLLQLDSMTGNFSMLKGTSGQSISTDNIDAWVWQDAGYWAWHSAQTDGSGNFLAEMELHGIAGKGDPELAYSITVKNSTGRTQTYTISADETIVPPLGGANSVFASIKGDVTTTSGALTVNQSQSFDLWAGATQQNAGVNLSSPGTADSYFASTSAAGPVGNWDYMMLSTSFTVSGGKGTVAIDGYASITPVPEADSYAMLLAGLGLVGFIARRRQVL